MERFVDDVVEKLVAKIPKENIEIVKNVLYVVLQDYDVAVKSTEITVAEDEHPREAKVYLASRLIDGLSEKSLMQYKRTIDKFFLMIHKGII